MHLPRPCPLYFRVCARRIHLHVCCLDQRPPVFDRGFLVRAERIGCLLLDRRDFLAEFAQPPLGSGIGKCRTHRSGELVDDRSRRILRHPEAVPNRDVEARQANLIDGRDIWRNCKPRARRHREGLYQLVAHLRQRIRRLVEHNLDLPSDQVLHRWTGPPVGHEKELGVAEILEIDAADMRGAARAGRARGHFIWIRLDPFDQRLQIARRYLGIGDDQLRIADE